MEINAVMNPIVNPNSVQKEVLSENITV